MDHTLPTISLTRGQLTTHRWLPYITQGRSNTPCTRIYYSPQDITTMHLDLLLRLRFPTVGVTLLTLLKAGTQECTRATQGLTQWGLRLL